MKISSMLFAGLLLFATAAHADDEVEIRAFVDAYDRAYVGVDTKGIEHLLADDYRVVVMGKVQNRAEGLADFTALDRSKINSMSTTIERIHADGDLAVVVGRINWANDKEKGAEHITLILRRKEGRWQAVHEHVSDVEE